MVCPSLPLIVTSLFISIVFSAAILSVRTIVPLLGSASACCNSDQELTSAVALPAAYALLLLPVIGRSTNAARAATRTATNAFIKGFLRDVSFRSFSLLSILLPFRPFHKPVCTFAYTGAYEIFVFPTLFLFCFLTFLKFTFCVT